MKHKTKISRIIGALSVLGLLTVGNAINVRTFFTKTDAFGLLSSDATVGVAVFPRPAGGYFAVSTAKRTSFSKLDVVVSAYQANGAAIFVSSIDSGGSFDDEGVKAVQDSQGSIYVLSVVHTPPKDRIMVTKVNVSGSVVYNRVFDGNTFGWESAPRDIAVDVNRNVWISCDTFTGANPARASVVRLNTTGNVTFMTSYTGNPAQDHEATRVVVDASGNGFLVGNNLSNGSSFFRKYSPTGSLLQTRVQSGIVINAALVDTNGFLYTTGRWVVGANSSAFVQKRDKSSLAVTWTRIANFAGNGDDAGNVLIQDASGAFYAAGTALNTTSYDGWVTRFNSAGTISWNRLINHGGDETFTHLALDGNGCVYAGGTQVVGLNRQLLVTKLTSTNTVAWQKLLLSGADDRDNLTGLTFSSTGNVLASGERVLNGADRLRLFCLRQSAVPVNDVTVTSKNTPRNGNLGVNDHYRDGGT
ncbi:MAG: hypothetical protein ABL962_14900, partial [Fimbriimonadaceae bacterium]